MMRVERDQGSTRDERLTFELNRAVVRQHSRSPPAEGSNLIPNMKADGDNIITTSQNLEIAIGFLKDLKYLKRLCLYL